MLELYLLGAGWNKTEVSEGGSLGNNFTHCFMFLAVDLIGLQHLHQAYIH